RSLTRQRSFPASARNLAGFGQCKRRRASRKLPWESRRLIDDARRLMRSHAGHAPVAISWLVRGGSQLMRFTSQRATVVAKSGTVSTKVSGSVTELVDRRRKFPAVIVDGLRLLSQLYRDVSQRPVSREKLGLTHRAAPRYIDMKRSRSDSKVLR